MGDLGPALRAGASAAKPLPRDSLVPGVRRAASLFWPDFKTVFVKNKQNSNSGQALEGAAVFFHSDGGESPQCSLTLSPPGAAALAAVAPARPPRPGQTELREGSGLREANSGHRNSVISAERWGTLGMV